jgi:nicotinamidase-related amidase
VGEPSALPALAEAAAAVDLIGHCAALARAARALDVPVFHCTAETRADGRGANRNARLFLGVRKSPVPLSPGSPGVEVPAPIGVEPSDVVLPRHHGLGPMTGTQLDPMLRNLGVTTIVGVGVSLNIGMVNFAFDAVNRGYQFVMPTDAVAGVPAEYGEAVLANTLSLVATLTTTADVLAAWST